MRVDAKSRLVADHEEEKYLWQDLSPQTVVMSEAMYPIN